MDSGPYAGQTLTLAQVKTDFAGRSVLAWVGIESSGTVRNGELFIRSHQDLTAGFRRRFIEDHGPSMPRCPPRSCRQAGFVIEEILATLGCRPAARTAASTARRSAGFG